MKKFTIEEKARRYDDAIERANSLLSSNELGNAWIYKVLPELKEINDDDKIREEIIDYLSTVDDKELIPYESWISWIEKQGEQNPADKVEPKFNVGDWIIFDGLTLYIKEIVKGFYRTISKDGINNSYDWDIDKVARLWNIQDAKEGDVLASKDGDDILIFRNFKDNVSFSSYYNIARKVQHYWLKNSFIPATKEQCELLFSKIYEAGYELDAAQEELKKIEQSPAWSEDDEPIISKIKNVLNAQECRDGATGIKMNPYKDALDWLKHLKDRYAWKPSDEQIEALRIARDRNDKIGFYLSQLYDDLKKLI